MELHRIFSVFNRCDGWLVCNRICNLKGVCAMKIKKIYMLFITMMSFYLIASTREAYGLTNKYERMVVVLTLLIGACIATGEIRHD